MSDQSNVPADDLFACQAWYEEKMGAMARLRQETATGWARWEKMGIEKKYIKACYTLSHEDDPEGEWRGMTHYLRVLGLIGSGKGFVEAMEEAGDEDADRPPAKVSNAEQRLMAARAYNDGWNSAFQGKGSMLSNNPHVAGSEAYVQWHRGHIDGAEAKRERDAAKPPAAKRGRPRKVSAPEEANGADEAASAPFELESEPEEEPDLGDPPPTVAERRAEASGRRLRSVT